MAEQLVEVKKEFDHNAGYICETLTDIKREEQLDIKKEFCTAAETIWNAGNDGLLGDNFNLHDFDPEKTTTNATLQHKGNKKLATTVNSAKIRPAPTLLNAQLRKRKLPAPSATNSVPLPPLKVKCICRLGNSVDLDAALPSTDEGLELFFGRMFEATRQLIPAHQRQVKMTLLNAVCQAEADIEEGRNCERCCT